MIDRTQLLADLQALLRKLEADLLERSSNVLEVKELLRSDYKQAKDAERTAQSYEEWRSDAITQMASAWVLSGVFVRFLEDNQLVDPPVIAGLGERLQRARDEHELYFRQHPQNTDRDYWLIVFNRLAKLPGAKEIFGDNNRIRELPNWLSGDAAGDLLRFFQRVEPGTGRLVHDFTDENWDTRFLGDLYQDLSKDVQEKFALKQTPEFIETFILDHTLKPALDKFQLEFQRQEFRMIDPACGSGHFLLGTFHRLLEHWLKKEPGTHLTELVQRSLNSVHGVDINPYAVAIARFRLLLAAMKSCGIKQLQDAPAFRKKDAPTLSSNLVCGDSLLHGEGTQLEIEGVLPEIHHYKSEDIEELNRILILGHYHVVVGNPPYIQVRDAALKQMYRKRFTVCHSRYALTAPFMELFFSLALNSGWVGQITGNSFSKNDFGKVLVEKFIPRIELSLVVDTSGAYIPGHGTPTVIIIGRNRFPPKQKVRAVLGIKGESERPQPPETGKVWQAIINQVEQLGSTSEFVSVDEMPQTAFHQHPWTFGGSGVSQLTSAISSVSNRRLQDLVEVGILGTTNADELFINDPQTTRRQCIERDVIASVVTGTEIRDWTISISSTVLFPYISNTLVSIEERPFLLQWIWSFRTELGNRSVSPGKTYFQQGKAWWSWHRISHSRLKREKAVLFSEISTRLHLAIDVKARVTTQTTPMLGFSGNLSASELSIIVATLSSSVACFWLKQNSKAKHKGDGGSAHADPAYQRFYFNTTVLRQCVIPQQEPSSIVDSMFQLARTYTDHSASQILRSFGGSNYNLRTYLQKAKQVVTQSLEQMIAFQEELDWRYYRLYELTHEDLTYKHDPPPISLGQRAFEIFMARKMAAGELQTTWFERHNSTPITELPSEWADDYKQLVQRRIELIESDRNIALIEQPEYKRRWNIEPWDSQLEKALREWLCDRLETYFDFDGRMNEEGKPTSKIEISLISIAQLADLARHDPEFLQVGELYRKDAAFDVLKLVAELVEAESVPLLPVLRYKPSGLRKHDEWKETWKQQRLEDAIDARTKLPKDHPDHVPESAAKRLKQQEIGDIPVPPKYTSSDFQKSHYWKLRGKLDVPKERWVSFPHCNAEDGTIMIAWAGYNHLQLAQAISTYFITVKEEFGGSNDPRLPPLLANLVELLPWLKQWHNAPDPDYNNLVMSDYFETLMQEQAHGMGKTLDEVSAWQPPAKTGRRR